MRSFYCVLSLEVPLMQEVQEMLPYNFVYDSNDKNRIIARELTISKESCDNSNGKKNL